MDFSHEYIVDRQPSSPLTDTSRIRCLAQTRRLLSALPIVALRWNTSNAALRKPMPIRIREGLYSFTLANFRKLREASQVEENNTVAAHKLHQVKAAARQRDTRRMDALEDEN